MVVAAGYPINSQMSFAGLAGCGCSPQARTLGNYLLGDAATQDKIGKVVTSSVSTVGGAFTPVIAHSLFASALTGVMPLWAVPVVGAAVAGVVLALAAILGRKRPHQKELATQAVNSVQDLMAQNLQAYMAGPRTRESQLMALEAFDQAWAWLASPEGCLNPALGDPGQDCVSQRQRGGNIGKPGSGHGEWCTAPEGCDMFVSMRDPIANDPRPGELEAAGAGSPASLLPGLPDVGSVELPGVGSVNVWMLVGAGLLAWAVMS